MNTVRKTHIQYSAGINASMGGNGRTSGFNAATDKTLAVLPTGLTLEIYRKPDGTTQCEWLPKVPNFRQKYIRDAVFPHYATAMQAYADQFGPPAHIHGSAYEGGAKA